MLKLADVVVTNPPFSLFGEYVQQLIDYKKDFIILGNLNAYSYKNIFPSIMKNDIRVGYTNGNSGMWFIIPDHYEIYDKKMTEKINDGHKYGRLTTICWYTTFPIITCTEMSSSGHIYKNHESDYPKYDNYDAIEVGHVYNIPEDYSGVMGLPITFIYKYNPNEFEIVGFLSQPIINGKPIYKRILVRRKEVK